MNLRQRTETFINNAANPVSIADIAKGTGRDKSNTSGDCQALVEQGRVEKLQTASGKTFYFRK